MMGGRIGLTSKEGAGSKFWFTFPVKVAKVLAIVSESKYTNESCNKNSLRILLVEDKAVNQKVINLMLTRMGHEVDIASNGQEALDFFETGKYNIILMDIQMPVMDGVTATRLLKERYRELPPIVGLSANAFEGDREKYMALGMDEYLTKPVKKDDFSSMIKLLGLSWNLF